MASVDQGISAFNGRRQTSITSAGDITIPTESVGAYVRLIVNQYMDEQGSAVYIGRRQSQISPAADAYAPSETYGVYVYTDSTQYTDDRGLVNMHEAYPETLPVPPAGGAVLTFKMQGFYATINDYETWTSTGTPNTSPPSGHTLTNISYVQIT